MKSFFKFCAFLLLLLPVKTLAFDGQIFTQEQVPQGWAVEIVIPKNEYIGINGTLMGNPIKFFEYEAQAKWDEPISRAAFINAVLDNKSDTPELIFKNPYLDINENNKYYKEILLASQLGIVKGNYIDYVRLFKPYTSITRAEAAKILYQAFNLTSLKRQTEVTLQRENDREEPVFEDLTKDHPLYFYMMECYKAGIFKGYEDGLIRPNSPINYNEAETILKRVLNNDKISIEKTNEYFRGLSGVDRRWAPGIYYIDLKLEKSGEGEESDIEYFSQPVEVLYTEFPTQSFRMAASNAELVNNGASERTWTRVYEVIAETNASRYYDDEQFQIPAEGYTTLGFGDILYINGIYSGSHFGIDYANEVGTEVFAANTGKVILSEYTEFFGNVVIIDHGENLFSMYLHLDELKCEADQMVNKGDLIGLMGTTGFSTGSHLHFSIMVGPTFVDPAQFYEEKE